MRRLLLPLLAVVTTALPAHAAAATLDRLAFTSGSSLYTINADGSGRTRVTPPGWNASAPAWSPDGSTIAFARDVVETETDQRLQIWTIGVDGSNPRPLTARPGRGVVETDPAWSADGRLMAFVRLRFHRDSLDGELVTAAPDGSGERVLVRAHERALAFLGSPAWSPDGTALLYSRTTLDNHANFRPSVYSVPSVGGAPKLFMRDADGASFEPDGRMVAVASVRDRNAQRCGEDECNFAGEIYVVRADGTGAVRITNEKGDDEHPAWSPDGQRIAFMSDRNVPGDGGPTELYSMRPDGSCLTWLTNGSASSETPAWQPGPGTSSDPGGCGAVPREPLIATPRLPASRRITWWWTGPVTGEGLMLTDVLNDKPTLLDLGYGDCVAFEPTACGASYFLSEFSTCDRDAFRFRGDVTPFPRRGALVQQDEPGQPEYSVYTGDTVVHLTDISADRVDRVLADLRPVGATGPPPSLPAPAVPARVRRFLDRVVAAHRTLHTFRAVARKLHIPRTKARNAVEFAAVLGQLGPRHSAHC